MNELVPINQRVPRGYFFQGQVQHLLFLSLLIPGTLALINPYLGDGRFLGWSDRRWVILLLAVVVTQQVLGWLVFRAQLCHSLLSRWFGRADIAVWGALFFPLLLARPLLFTAVALSDAGSHLLARPLEIGLGLVLLLPALYTLWSIKHDFGLERALGGDHFRHKYQHMPLVSAGAFRYSANAMYAFVFLLFWSIALFASSRAALGLALFQHTYIWVHWYCTERPDVDMLYGSQPHQSAPHKRRDE